LSICDFFFLDKFYIEEILYCYKKICPSSIYLLAVDIGIERIILLLLLDKWISRTWQKSGAPFLSADAGLLHNVDSLLVDDGRERIIFRVIACSTSPSGRQPGLYDGETTRVIA